MAIRVPNLGLGDGKTGDTELKIRQDYNHNFSDTSNAASRLVGPLDNQIPLAQDTFKANYSKTAVAAFSASYNCNNFEVGTLHSVQSNSTLNAPQAAGIAYWSVKTVVVEASTNPLQIARGLTGNAIQFRQKIGGNYSAWATILTSANTTKDANGFLKGASPVIDMYDNKIGLNQDAEQQGGITFEKLGVGDYLVKGSLGFAQEGWYIETPKDANGNVLVAVVYEQLANNDLSIKTYAKRFDDETGDIVANLTKPRDIPAGRFISLRLHELPKEPPVMPTETQTEV